MLSSNTKPVAGLEISVAIRPPAAALPYLTDLIGAQMYRTPAAIALQFADRCYSYAELDRASAAIAAAVCAHVDCEREVLIGVCIERSFEMVAALLGVMRAGAAYLPLDPALPSARLADIVADARPDLLLGSVAGLGVLGSLGVPDMTVDAALDTTVVALAEPAMFGSAQARRSADALAYVMYTSGSTGRPKGVEVRHSGVANLLGSMIGTPGIGGGDVLLAATRMTFDVSVVDFFLPLVCGARIVLADQQTAADPRRLAALIASSGATILQATPTTGRALIATGWAGDPTLRIWSGGEPLTRELAERLLPRCRELWNLYGPTETTVWSTAYRVRSSAEPSVSIGLPIADTTLHILDERLLPVADGGIGELCIGGAGLARGYRGRPDLTADRFPTLPSGERLYRTGDLACRELDGTLSCRGRIDDQVKIRGHRVEMGEVEAVLCRHASVASCAVRCLPDAIGENALFGYVVAKDDAELAPAELATFLRERLPAYMVPHRIMAVDAMPLTPNGKIDRKALPDPSDIRGARPDARGRAGKDRELAAIWMELLGLDDVVDDDDFFDLGGYSLLTVHLQCRVEESFGRKLSLGDLFVASSFRAMLRLIESDGEVPEWQPLILQQHGSRAPLHWLDGGPLLRVVARQMDGERPVFGINLTPDEESELLAAGLTVERVAAVLVRRLEMVQPTGALHIGGWCRWGIVAYETACQLRAQGRDVHDLILLDAECPTAIERGWRKPLQRWRRLLAPSGRDDRMSTGFASFGEEVERATRRYAPSPYAGAVSLLRPRETHRRGRHDGGWGEPVADLRVFVTPGDHLTMIRMPHAVDLAAALDAALSSGINVSSGVV
jgi:amino acid adenylation domain-containing protein